MLFQILMNVDPNHVRIAVPVTTSATVTPVRVCLATMESTAE